MRERFVVPVCVVALLLPLACPAALSAADGAGSDPTQYLTDEEKAYVSKLTAAYAASRAALDQLSGQVDAAVGGALLGLLGGGASGPGPLEMVGNVAACASALAAQAPAFQEAPPESFASLASINTAIAARLQGTFGPTMGMVVEEGKRRALEAARDKFGGLFAGLLGAGPEPEKTDSTVFKARFVSSVKTEIADIRALLDSGQGALNARLGAIAEVAEAGSELLEWLLGEECFIATAAYGTNTAAEIDVLRNFRDEVLSLSPAGRDLTSFYYAASPPIADFIARHEVLRTVVRECIVDPVVRMVSWLEPLRQPA